MRYTTFENIALRLEGRLDVVESRSASNPWANTLGKIQTHPQLVENFANQVEAYLNSIFEKVYIIPFQLTHQDTRFILADMVESLVVSRLLSTYFRGSPSPAVGADVSGLAGDDRRHAEELIKMYTAGHNIQYPGSAPTQPDTEPVWLPGEIPNPRPKDSITRNYVLVGDRGFMTQSKEFGLGLLNEQEFKDQMNTF
jgi:hypothetical protein